MFALSPKEKSVFDLYSGEPDYISFKKRWTAGLSTSPQETLSVFQSLELKKAC